VSPDRQDRFGEWFEALERRHLARLTPHELRRALQALSSLYVERRDRLGSGAALEGEGKRAAFALFYSPLHFLTLRGIVRSLALSSPLPETILDLGCGTGPAGAAWALECGGRPRIIGVDRNRWAAAEARWTYVEMKLHGKARPGDLVRVPLGGRGEAILAAFTVNELEVSERQRLLPRLIRASHAGSRILVVEPIARRGFPWWEQWSAAFLRAGGRSDDWRFPSSLPERLRLLDRATGMDHSELTARSLYLPATRAKKPGAPTEASPDAG